MNNEKVIINETILTMAKQINAKELKFAKFILLFDNPANQITVCKGKKGLRIWYDEGSDLYNLQTVQIKKFFEVVSDVKKGYYADQLQREISSYFNFEYVMDTIKVVGVNC